MTKLKLGMLAVSGVNMTSKEFFGKKTVIFGLLATIISLASYIWFTNTAGFQGTLNWHTTILKACIGLFVTVWLPAIFLILNLIKDNKLTKILSYVFSGLMTLVWIGVFIAFNLLASAKVDNSGINLIHLNGTQNGNLNKNQTGTPAFNHIALASDPHWGASTANPQARNKILQNIEAGNYDMALITGDIADFGMMKSHYQEATDDIRKNMPTTPLRAIPGNHDALINGLPNFKRIFMDKNDKYYFRMDSGKNHILVLNMLWDSSELTKNQEKWLIKQLEEIPQEENVVVITHCYVVSSGYYDPAAGKSWGDLEDVMSRLCPIFEKYHVDLHLSGHDHFFEFLEKDGVNYLVLGAMGGKLDSPLTYHSPYSKWVNNSDFGYVDLQFDDGTIKISCLSEDNQLLFEKSIKTK